MTNENPKTITHNGQLYIRADLASIRAAKGKRDTSEKAVDGLKYALTKIRLETLSALSMGKKSASEIAKLIDKSILTVRPRTSELAEIGFIKDSGERFMNRSNNPEIRWQITEAGSIALNDAINREAE